MQKRAEDGENQWHASLWTWPLSRLSE